MGGESVNLAVVLSTNVGKAIHLRDRPAFFRAQALLQHLDFALQLSRSPLGALTRPPLTVVLALGRRGALEIVHVPGG